jgi:hypothetical protein
MVILVSVVLLVVLGVPYFFHRPTPPQNETINSPTGFSFEIASSTESRTLGLSGRITIPTHYGMLFVFETDGVYGFWMKDMLVPIDIIWLSREKEIIGIEADISPDSFPQAYYPPTSVRYVLETRAGEAQRQGWAIGSTIWLPL